MGPDLYAWRYTGFVAAVTDNFADAFVRENVVRVYMMRGDVITFES